MHLRQMHLSTHTMISKKHTLAQKLAYRLRMRVAMFKSDHGYTPKRLVIQMQYAWRVMREEEYAYQLMRQKTSKAGR